MNGITAVRIIREREASGELPPGPMKILCLVSSSSRRREGRKQKLTSSPSCFVSFPQTGNAREEQINDALKAGMNEVIVKPYKIDNLLNKIRAVREED